MRTYSEPELTQLAIELASEIRAIEGDAPRVVFQGPMGVGKSTFARALLEELGVHREAEGSPTFAIAHEYRGADGQRIVHADGYRLKSEAELEATGLLETLWDPEVIVLFEWLDLFSETEASLRRSDLPTVWIRFEFDSADQNRRKIEVIWTKT